MQEDKLSYLENLISELSQKDNKYILLVFLLRCQMVEYSLKYLLANHPFKPKWLISKDFLEIATLGMVIGKLEKIEDDYLDSIIEKAKKFNKIRKYIVHHFLTSGASIPKIKNTLLTKIDIADEIEAEIHYLFNFISEEYYGGYTYQELSLMGIV